MSNVGRDAHGIADYLNYNEWEVDSTDRTTGTLNHPRFILDNEWKDVVGFKVLEVEIPFSYYVVNSVNGTLTLTEPTGAATPLTITMTPGNYTASSLAQALETALNSAPGSIGTYNVTFSSTTSKFTVTSSVSEAFVLTFGTTGDFGVTNPRLWLGMAAGANTATSSGLLVAPNVAMISGPNYLYLCSSQLGILNNETLRRGSYPQSGPIIAKIPVNTNAGGIILWTDPDPSKYFEVDSGTISNIDLYLAYGGQGTTLTEVDLNGTSFSAKIAFITTETQTAKRSGGNLMSGRAKRILVAA